MTLEDVITRLLASSTTMRYGDRDLDADIYEALGYLVKRRPSPGSGHAWKYRDRKGGPWYAMRNFTRSLDDAVSLYDGFLPPEISPRAMQVCIDALGRRLARTARIRRGA